MAAIITRIATKRILNYSKLESSVGIKTKFAVRIGCMRKNRLQKKLWLALPLLVIALIFVVLINPSLQKRILWKWELATTYLHGVINPVSAVPTANAIRLPSPTLNSIPSTTPAEILTATSTPNVQSTIAPSPTATAIPVSVVLDTPAHEKQDINNCGPATLTMYLRYYGWQGDQFTISDVIKPIPQDRNVNVEELDYFVKNYAGWLQTIYRVGGDTQLLKQLLAAGVPVMIEETFHFDENNWPNDDRWAGHYLLINGYDEQNKKFLGQDSYVGENQWIDYDVIDKQWQAFNRVYILVYLPDQEDTIRQILGENWDVDANRQHALDVAKQETESDPQNVFAWFNLGSNYVYFDENNFATTAYDKAREIGWPQRMLRYQFGPFLAYFHSLRNDDLMALVDYALQRTPNSEEALLWKGWGLYRAGQKEKALESFQAALTAHPNYLDAQYAIDYVNQN